MSNYICVAERKRSKAQTRAKADTNFKQVLCTVKNSHIQSKNQTSDFDVYILCKGLNSGKPLEKPCPNCFYVPAKIQMIWIFTKPFFRLVEAKHFHQFLTGSVIPFIRISDFKSTIKAQAEAVSKNKYAFVKDVHKVKLIERKEKQMYETLALLADVKKAMMYRHF
ncbi:MAG: hypothetical protein IPG82_00005, partial [Saprospiraceae bacterium]|nr:hypothetical protein [Saprospiraceae bacterium]